MKRINRIFALALLLLCVSSLVVAQSATPQKNDISELAPPVHPATPAQIREYLALTHAIETAHKVMDASIKSSRATSASYFTTSFWDDMEKALMNIDIVGPAIPAYQKYFSQEDMAAMIVFYKTPAGQHVLAAQPFISSVLSDSLRAAGKKVGEQVGLKHKDEIERLKSQPPSGMDVVVTSN